MVHKYLSSFGYQLSHSLTGKAICKPGSSHLGRLPVCHHRQWPHQGVQSVAEKQGVLPRTDRSEAEMAPAHSNGQWPQTTHCTSLIPVSPQETQPRIEPGKRNAPSSIHATSDLWEELQSQEQHMSVEHSQYVTPCSKCCTWINFSKPM